MKLAFVATAGAFSIQNIRETEHAHYLRRMASNYAAPLLDAPPSAEQEGWVEDPSLPPSAFWDSASPPATPAEERGEERGEIKCLAAHSKAGTSKLCEQLIREGYYWGKAIRISEPLACPSKDCQVNITFSASLHSREKLKKADPKKLSFFRDPFVTHHFPPSLQIHRQASLTHNRLVPATQAEFVVWIKPLYWAAATWYSETIFTGLGSRSSSNLVENFFPVGANGSLFLALGISPSAPSLAFMPPTSIAVHTPAEPVSAMQ